MEERSVARPSARYPRRPDRPAVRATTHRRPRDGGPTSGSRAESGNPTAWNIRASVGSKRSIAASCSECGSDTARRTTDSADTEPGSSIHSRNSGSSRMHKASWWFSIQYAGVDRTGLGLQFVEVWQLGVPAQVAGRVDDGLDPHRPPVLQILRDRGGILSGLRRSCAVRSSNARRAKSGRWQDSR